MNKTIVKQQEKEETKFKDCMSKLTGLLCEDSEATKMIKEELANYGLVQKRRCFYTPERTVRLFLLQALNGNQSCNEMLTNAMADYKLTGKKSVSLDSGNYARARKKIPEKFLSNWAMHLGQEIDHKSPAKWKWKGRNVKIIDGTTFTAADTPENQKYYPQPKSQKKGLGFPKLRAVAIASLSTGSILAAKLGCFSGPRSSEMCLLMQLIHHFGAGDIALGDRYYGSYFLYAMLQLIGADGLFPLHAGREPGGAYGRGKKFFGKERNVIWFKPKKPDWMSYKLYHKLPTQLEIREVYDKKQIYVTTINKKQATRNEIIALYKMRYGAIEFDFKSLKSTMGIRRFKSKHPDMVRKEFWVHILAYNMVRNMGIEGSLFRKFRPFNNDKIKPRNISFCNAKAMLLKSMNIGILVDEGITWIKKQFDIFKGCAASVFVGYQERENEPHVIKDKPSGVSYMYKNRTALKKAMACG